MTDHLADVRRYDALADEDVVDRIVKHLGVALRNQDSSTVACRQQAELDRVAKKWCGKKLGADPDRAMAVIELVCETMAADRFKSRVTFYYLCAKHLDRLSLFKPEPVAEGEVQVHAPAQ